MDKNGQKERLCAITELMSDRALARFARIGAEVGALEYRLADLQAEAARQRRSSETLEDAKALAAFEAWSSLQAEIVKKQLEVGLNALEVERAAAQQAFGKHQVLKRLR